MQLQALMHLLQPTQLSLVNTKDSNSFAIFYLLLCFKGMPRSKHPKDFPYFSDGNNQNIEHSYCSIFPGKFLISVDKFYENLIIATVLA